MHPTIPSFERYAAERLLAERDEITRAWVERLTHRLGVAPERVLPRAQLLDDIPLVLERAAEFLLVPEPEKLTAERIVTDEMRRIARLRHRQGWKMEEVVRELDELAQLLDRSAIDWIRTYPGDSDPEAVGRTLGRLNRTPLLMGQVLVRALEDERRGLLQQINAAEEAERMRLSRELHDQVGQLVTGMLLGLEALKRETEPGAGAARIEELKRLADRIARETQQLALDLRPPALGNLGLAAALEALAQEWSERAGIESDFHSTGMDGLRLPPATETTLYRIAQEGLTNVAKHAAAHRVGVLLEARGRVVQLILEDDGAGFDVDRTLAAPEKSRRLGLRGMRERVALLGGSIEVESTPGEGTTLFVRVPRSPEPDADEGAPA